MSRKQSISSEQIVESCSVRDAIAATKATRGCRGLGTRRFSTSGTVRARLTACEKELTHKMWSLATTRKQPSLNKIAVFDISHVRLVCGSRREG